MALPPRDHHIPLAEAAAHTKRYRDAHVSDIKAGAFARDQVLELLNQPGCVGLRIYFGRDAAGAPSLVLTGFNASDSDLISGTILEIAWPCPPWCGAANTLNS